MNRVWRYLALVSLSVVLLLAACAPASAPAAPSAAKPAEKAAEKPAEKAAEKPVEKAAAPPVEKAEAKPAAKAEPAAAPKDLPPTVALGTPPVGSSYHSSGVGVAKVASDRTPMKVIVTPSGGPNAWMPQLDTGEIGLGVINGMDIGWAYNGGPGFEKPAKNARVLLKGNLIPTTGLAVRNDSAIKSIKDLRGKRVTSEYGGHAVIGRILTAWLESAGLTWDDVKPVPVADVNSGLKALREGRADAAFGASTTTASSLEVDSAIGMRLLDFGDIPAAQGNSAPKESVEKLQKLLPAATIYSQKKEGWLKSDNTMIHYPIYVAASAKLSPDAAYVITKALYDNDKELQVIYDWLKGWAQATMFDAQPGAPYHEGAIRFWKEKGQWNAAAEANQKKLLGQ